jgi:hypothetical protein
MHIMLTSLDMYMYVVLYCIVAETCLIQRCIKIAALKDLFSHYVEAWKSWYSEVSGKESLQIS